MKISIKLIEKIVTGSVLLAGVILAIRLTLWAQSSSADEAPKTVTAVDRDLAHQILATMLKVPGNQPGHRPVHAKGMVCEGIFTPVSGAKELSKAVHFQGAPVPVTVRFSDGATMPLIPDNSPDAGPRGMAVRFKVPGGGTDIVAMSHNGFVVGTGGEFLALQEAIVASDPSKPHPWPIEEFVSTHPAALKFVVENKIVPASFAEEAFFSNDAFTFVNHDGIKRLGRYKILPVDGERSLSDAEAKNRSVNFLMDGLRTRLTNGPIQFRLVVQLPNPGDSTKDPSVVWPDDRQKIEVGTITVQSVVADSVAVEKELAFDPINLTDGIELSDDPLPALRSRVYSLSARYRQKN